MKKNEEKDLGCTECKNELTHVGGGFLACGTISCSKAAIIQAYYVFDKEQAYV